MNENNKSCVCEKYPSKILYIDGKGCCKKCGGRISNVATGMDHEASLITLTKESTSETITKDEIIDLLKQFEGIKRKLQDFLKKL